jgi:hypothetical protein
MEMMDNEKIIGLLNSIISELETIRACTFIDACNFDDELWEFHGDNLWIKLCLNKNALVQYLNQEYHAGHRIDPQIDYLRQCLLDIGCSELPASQLAEHDVPNFYDLQIKCREWVGWIERYYPRELTEQDQDNEQVDDDHCGTLPSELNTEKAKKYFPRAAAAGYVDNGKWIKSQVQLAYFCSKVYSNPRPINALEDYFGVKKLSASISQVELETPKRSDAIQWRKEIDDNIFYD